jgi:hypothetical protein
MVVVWRGMMWWNICTNCLDCCLRTELANVDNQLASESGVFSMGNSLLRGSVWLDIAILELLHASIET